MADSSKSNIKNLIKECFCQQKYSIVIFLLYLIITLVMVFHHEIYCDEARDYLRTLNTDFLTMINVVRYDGHAFLWSFLLYPLGCLKINIFIMQIIALLLCYLAVFITIYKIKINLISKILFIFSAGMLYYIPCIARSYSLVPLCGLLWALSYTKRKAHPYLYVSSIILLSQTHMYLWGLCFAASAIFVAEKIFDICKNKNYKAFYCITILLLYFLFLFFTYKDVLLDNRFTCDILTKILDYKQYISVSAIKGLFIKYLIIYNKMAFMYLLTFIGLMAFLFRLNYKLFIICITSIIYIYVIFKTVWYYGILYQKMYLIVLCTLFCCFIPFFNKKETITFKIYNVLLVLFLLLNFHPVFAKDSIVDDIQHEYNNAKKVSNILNNDRNNNQEYEVLFIHPSGNKDLFDVYLKNPYLDVDFYNADSFCEGGENDETIINDDFIKGVNNGNHNYKYIVINWHFNVDLNPEVYEPVIDLNEINNMLLIIETTYEYSLMFKNKTY